MGKPPPGRQFPTTREAVAMGAYLDRLNAQYDEIRDGIDTLINRAAEDQRDVTEAEQTQVDRDRSRLDELQAAITHYSGLETQTETVATLRRSVPSTPTSERAAAVQDAYDAAAEFPSVGDYAITLHRAMVAKDPDAIAKIERATAHQLVADNPGLIPRPILGPVINMIDSSRPFINSITKRPLPAGKFDRPTVQQHVAVGKQAAEKTLTESQKMIVGLLSVTAATYAGHLNISRQDIKWTNPGILNIVFEDFAAMYALATCSDACAQFVTSLAGETPVPIDASGPNPGAAVTAAMYAGTATALDNTDLMPSHLWVAPDVWGQLGSMFTSNGVPAFPSMSLTSQGGNPLGLTLVVDQHLPDGYMVSGPNRFVEWYEDVDGLMQVGEPDVLGQLVGYAGFAAFLNVVPDAFTVYTLDTTPA